jgi:hypothetical protein
LFSTSDTVFSHTSRLAAKQAKIFASELGVTAKKHPFPHSFFFQCFDISTIAIDY